MGSPDDTEAQREHLVKVGFQPEAAGGSSTTVGTGTVIWSAVAVLATGAVLALLALYGQLPNVGSSSGTPLRLLACPEPSENAVLPWNSD